MILISCTNRPRIACDGIAYQFKILYDGKGNNLVSSLNLLIDNNTEILENCSVVDYSELRDDKIVSLLSNYSLKAYNVSFSCDILDFDAILYEKGNKLYRFLSGLGPCGRLNVDFDNTVSFYPPEYQITKSPFEYELIEKKLVDYEFCIEVHKRARIVNGLDITDAQIQLKCRY